MTKLRKARVKNGISQADLSRRAGVDVFRVCRYETGCARPGPENAKKLAAALGASVESLFPHLASNGVPSAAQPATVGDYTKPQSDADKLAKAMELAKGMTAENWAEVRSEILESVG